MELAIGILYLIGVLGALIVGRSRAGLTQLGRLSAATVILSLPWFLSQMASLLFWPVFLVVWLARGRPETPWEAVSSRRGGAIQVRRREGVQPAVERMRHARVDENRVANSDVEVPAVSLDDAMREHFLATLTQTGWKQGKEWDDAYEYLAGGNAQLMGQLNYRFVNGPIAWKK